MFRIYVETMTTPQLVAAIGMVLAAVERLGLGAIQAEIDANVEVLRPLVEEQERCVQR